MIRIADQYLIAPLKEWCLNTVSDHFVTLENVPMLLHEIPTLNAPALETKLTDFITMNAQEAVPAMLGIIAKLQGRAMNDASQKALSITDDSDKHVLKKSRRS